MPNYGKETYAFYESLSRGDIKSKKQYASKNSKALKEQGKASGRKQVHKARTS